MARLDNSPRSTLDLMPDKHPLMPRVAKHGLEIVDQLLVLGAGIDADKLTQSQPRPPLTQALSCFTTPVWVQFTIGLGNAMSQRRVEDDR